MAALPPLFAARRMRAYPRIMLGVYVVAILGLLVSSRHLVDWRGKPLGYDFITFWAASHLTLDGRPAAAFDSGAIGAAERRAVPANQELFLWHYPPTYQLIITPLALLPYIPSYLLFAGTTLLVFLFAARPLLRQPEPILLLLAFPATFLAVLGGQNSLISAALFAGALLRLRSSPGQAGMLLGLLAFKPQLGLLVPFALAAARQWRAFAFAAASAGAFAAIATAAFGIDLWRTFVLDGGSVMDLVSRQELPWAKMPSAFVFLCYFGLPQAIAYGVQATITAAALLVVIHVWRRRGAGLLSGATLVTGTLVASPFLFDYELAIMAVPLAILATDMARRGSNGWERVCLLSLYALPAFMAGIAGWTHFQIGFPMLLLALALCCWRSLGEPLSDAAKEAQGEACAVRR